MSLKRLSPLRSEPRRILHVDTECRPLSWYGGDWVTKEITALAWQWNDEEVNHVRLMQRGHHLKRGFVDFRNAYDEAGVVTGHYIRGFDLPLLNGSMLDLGMKPLPDKWTIDTKLDLLKFSGLSKSQENLAALLGLEAGKVSMDQQKWREANRLTPEGIQLTSERVVGDVVQHRELFNTLRAFGWLGPGKLWTSTSSGSNRGYHA